MKQHIENLLQIAIKQLQEEGSLPGIPAFIQVEQTKDKQHGDFATNIALILAKTTQKKPHEIAARINKALPYSSYIQKAEAAGPGFINFFLTPQAMNDVVAKILTEKEKYGRSE